MPQYVILGEWGYDDITGRRFNRYSFQLPGLKASLEPQEKGPCEDSCEFVEGRVEALFFHYPYISPNTTVVSIFFSITPMKGLQIVDKG